MQIINITVRRKVASADKNDFYVCGNSDFMIRFDFDAEWEQYGTKTARFIKPDGTYQEQVFTHDECPVPIIEDTYKISVGVYAGNLSTTTPAYVPARKSILCGGGVHAEPEPDVYNQIIAKIDTEIKTAVDAADVATASAETAVEARTAAEASEKAAKEHEDNAGMYSKVAGDAAASTQLMKALTEQAAERAEQAANASGWMDMHIDDNGHLIYTRSETVDAVDFEMQDGRLMVSYG